MAFTSKAFVALATGLVALTDVVAATGNAIVENNCGFDVYLWHVSVDHADSQPTVINANGGHYSEPYVTCTTGGVSLKLSDSATQETYITQYEYTLDPGNVWYDISNVNCKDSNCPFWQGGMNLASNTGCPVVNCAPNEFLCHAAYNLFNDDWASHACAPTSDLTLTLCPGGSSGSSSSGSGSGSAAGGSSAAAAATTPSSTATTPSSTPKSSPVHAKADIVETTPSTTPTSTTSTSTTPPPAPSTTLSTSTTSSTPKPKPTTKKHSHKAKPKPHTTAAPKVDIPIVTQWFTETAVETAYSTVIVTARDAAHDGFHKNKKREAMMHRHHRRHEQQI